MNAETNTTPILKKISNLFNRSRLAITLEVILVVGLMLSVRNASVLLLFVGWASLRLRQHTWQDVGLRKRDNFGKVITAGVGIAALYQLFSIFVFVPVIHQITGTPLNLNAFENLQGNIRILFLWICVSWTIAAFGEELSYRGYLFNRITDLMGENRVSAMIAAFVISILFGFAHAYQGVTGIVESFFSGVLFSVLYLLAKRNLWLPIITHGMIDTIGFLLIFFGLYG